MVENKNKNKNTNEIKNKKEETANSNHKEDLNEKELTEMSENEGKIVGRVKGAGETTFQFNFITPTQEYTKVGEYIYYNSFDNQDQVQVLCRVTNITPIRHYPEEMLSNPQLEPDIVAQTIDYQTEGMEIYEITAQIIGYYHEDLKMFINPRKLPNPGDPIFLARNQDLSSWLFRVGEDESSGLTVGHLINRPEEKVNIVLDMNKIVSTHLAVLAATGSGKSYTVGVILEEMMKPKNRGAVMVLDPHGEYGTFIEAQNHPAFKINNKYTPKVEVLSKEKLRVRFCELDFSELIRILKNITEKMQYLLFEALKKVREDNPYNYTSSDLTKKLNEMKNGNNEKSIVGILWRLRKYVINRKLISDSKHKNLKDLLKPGQITILNMDDMEKNDQQVIASVFLNRILKSRISSKTGKGTVDKNDELPYPVMVVLEEGHRFAPANDISSSKRVLKTILSEGRKFGFGICIISQRPGKLDSDVLSQCMTQIIMKITNPLDQQTIRTSVESISEDIMMELPGLTTGQAVITGNALNTPVLAKIRKRLLSHGGKGYDAGKAWRDYWNKPAKKPKGVPIKSQKDEELF